MNIFFLSSVFTNAQDAAVELSVQDLSILSVGEKIPFDILKQNYEYLVLDFWATWCEPCQASMPFFDEQSRFWKKQSVLFVGINEDSELSEVQEFLKKKPIEYVTLMDKDRKLSKKLGVSAIPRTFIFDKKLHLVKLLKGYTPDRQKEYKEEFEKIFKQRSSK